MKKAIVTAACLMTIVAAFTGCNTNDGRVSDKSTASTASRVNEANRYDSANRTVYDSNNEVIDSNTVARATDRDRLDSNYDDNYDNDGNGGIIRDVGSMVGAGVEDVGRGVENIGDSVASHVDEWTNDDEYYTDTAM